MNIGGMVKQVAGATRREASEAVSATAGKAIAREASENVSRNVDQFVSRNTTEAARLLPGPVRRPYDPLEGFEVRGLSLKQLQDFVEQPLNITNRQSLEQAERMVEAANALSFRARTGSEVTDPRRLLSKIDTQKDFIQFKIREYKLESARSEIAVLKQERSGLAQTVERLQLDGFQQVREPALNRKMSIDRRIHEIEIKLPEMNEKLHKDYRTDTTRSAIDDSRTTLLDILVGIMGGYLRV